MAQFLNWEKIVKNLFAFVLFSISLMAQGKLIDTIPDFYYLNDDTPEESVLVHACYRANGSFDCSRVASVAKADWSQFTESLLRQSWYNNHTGRNGPPYLPLNHPYYIGVALSLAGAFKGCSSHFQSQSGHSHPGEDGQNHPLPQTGPQYGLRWIGPNDSIGGIHDHSRRIHKRRLFRGWARN